MCSGSRWPALRITLASFDSPAAQLPGRDQSELPLRPQDLLRLLDLAAGHRGVGAERQHHEVGQLVAAARLPEQPQALGELAAAARIDLVADPRQRRQCEEHR